MGKKPSFYTLQRMKAQDAAKRGYKNDTNFFGNRFTADELGVRTYLSAPFDVPLALVTESGSQLIVTRIKPTQLEIDKAFDKRIWGELRAYDANTMIICRSDANGPQVFDILDGCWHFLVACDTTMPKPSMKKPIKGDAKGKRGKYAPKLGRTISWDDDLTFGRPRYTGGYGAVEVETAVPVSAVYNSADLAAIPMEAETQSPAPTEQAEAYGWGDEQEDPQEYGAPSPAIAETNEDETHPSVTTIPLDPSTREQLLATISKLKEKRTIKGIAAAAMEEMNIAEDNAFLASLDAIEDMAAEEG